GRSAGFAHVEGPGMMTREGGGSSRRTRASARSVMSKGIVSRGVSAFPAAQRATERRVRAEQPDRSIVGSILQQEGLLSRRFADRYFRVAKGAKTEPDRPLETAGWKR